MGYRCGSSELPTGYIARQPDRVRSRTPEKNTPGQNTGKKQTQETGFVTLDLASLTWYAQRIALKAVMPTSDPRV